MSTYLIFGFSIALLPHLKGQEGLVAQQRVHGFVAMVGGESYLAVDEVVVEVDGGSIVTVVGIINGVEVCPINGTQTHRAGLARGVYHAAFKTESAQLACGLAYAVYLGMGCGVVIKGYAV